MGRSERFRIKVFEILATTIMTVKTFLMMHLSRIIDALSEQYHY